MQLKNRDGSFSEITAILNPTDDAYDVAVRVEGSDEFVSVPKWRLYVNGGAWLSKEMPQVEIVHGPRESRGMLAMSNLPYSAAVLDGEDAPDEEAEQILRACGFGDEYFYADPLAAGLDYEDYFGDTLELERVSR